MSVAPGRDEGQFDAGHVPSAPRGNTLRYDQKQVPGPVLQPIHVSRHEDNGTIIQYNSCRYIVVIILHQAFLPKCWRHFILVF